MTAKDKVKRCYLQEVPVIFHRDDIKHLRRKYKAGQRLSIIAVREDGAETAVKRRKQFTVIKAFEHHLSCMDEYGQRESFGYIELEQIAI